MRRSAIHLCVLLALAGLFSPAAAQQPAVGYSQRLDSSEIKRLPLTRSAEIPSFLTGTQIGLSYDATTTGATGGRSIWVDGVPAPNLLLPAASISTLDLVLHGTTAAISEPNILFYHTRRTSDRWTGYARGASDQLLPGSIGLARVEAGLRAPLGKFLHIAADVTRQTADQTEFNNYHDVQLFESNGIETAIGGVAVPKFEALDAGTIPTSNWRELLANARLDLSPTSKSNIFLAGYFSRAEGRVPFGNTGACNACALFLPAAQHGTRSDAALFTLGIDHGFGSSALHMRAARVTSTMTSGVLSDGYKFLVDDKTFPVDDALVRALSTNGPTTPFASNRSDLDVYQEYRSNPFAVMSGFATRGVASGAYTYADDARWYAAVSLESTTKANHLRIGGKLTAYDVRYANVGYRQHLPSEAIWKEAPLLKIAYAEDEIRLPGLIAQIGVRLDNYDSRAVYPVTPGYFVPDDPSTFAKAETKTLISPRIAFAVPMERFTLRAAWGQYARVPSFSSQFNGKNTDYFQYHNTSVNTVFVARALDLTKVTAASVGGELRASERVRANVELFANQADKVPYLAAVRWADPTNPGALTYLRMVKTAETMKDQGIDAMIAYSATQNVSVEAGGTYSKQKIEVPPPTILMGATTSVTTFTALAKAQQHGVNGTLAVRARSPIETGSFDGYDYLTKRTAWLVRADARVGKEFSVAALHGEVWLDALRFAGSSELYQNAFDANAIAGQVQSHLETLGGGAVRDNIDLATLASAGPGVRTDVDLHFLQQAEQRFGNGDHIFSAAEQTAAFTAAEKLRVLAGTPLSQSRRIQLGVAIHF